MGDKLGANGIEMDVSRKFLRVAYGLDKNGPIAPLEQMPLAFVLLIHIDGVLSDKKLHQLR